MITLKDERNQKSMGQFDFSGTSGKATEWELKWMFHTLGVVPLTVILVVAAVVSEFSWLTMLS